MIELLVVISVIGLLASVVLVALNDARKKSRDTKRLADMAQMQKALDLYYNINNRYPSPNSDSSCSGWDTTADGVFVSALRTAGIIAQDIKDPSINASCANYRYYRYGAGTSGCSANRGDFYVLGVNDMETSGRPYPQSPGWSCPSRNWQNEFDWVVGKFEK